jgi:hypothetical protein
VQKPRDKFKEYELIYYIAQCNLDESMSELLNSLEDMLSIEMDSDMPVAGGSLSAE